MALDDGRSDLTPLRSDPGASGPRARVAVDLRILGAVLVGVVLTLGVFRGVGHGSSALESTREGLWWGPSALVQARRMIETLTHTVHLPLVQRNHCSSSSDVISPFSMQIAALHQVDASSPELLDALGQSGADWARVRIDWSIIQPAPPPADYVWGPYYDEKLALVAETGVRLIATVGDPPEWAADERCAPIYPGRMDDFAQFLTELVNRYQLPPYNIKHWELINEPDGTTSGLGDVGLGCWANQNTDEDGVRYAEMLQVASDAIRRADPGATVLMGGLAYDWFTEYGGPFDRYFPDDVMKAGGGDYVDVLNLHYFPDFRREWERWDARSCDRRLGWLNGPTCGDTFDGEGEVFEAVGLDLVAKTSYFRRRIHTCFGLDKPLWVTELAEHGYSDDTTALTRQARYVIRGYARGLAAGVENITWYALTAPNDGFEQDLLFDDWTPKPAYVAYQTMAGELKGYVYSHDWSVWASDGCPFPDPPRGYRAVREAYVFRTPCGQEKTVAWSDEADGATLSFTPADRLRVIDRQGEVTFITDGGAGDLDGVRNGVVKLQLSADPVFVSVR